MHFQGHNFRVDLGYTDRQLKHSVGQGTLVFQPPYPVAAGVNYRVVFHPPGGAVVETSIAGPPRPVNPVARVAVARPYFEYGAW
jgi:hypothetical protein